MLRYVDSFLLPPAEDEGEGEDNSANNSRILRPAGGFRPVRVRSAFGGNDREVRMVKLQGFHVIAEACDEGPKSIMLITRGQVHGASLKAFDDFVAAESAARRQRLLAATPTIDSPITATQPIGPVPAEAGDSKE